MTDSLILAAGLCALALVWTFFSVRHERRQKGRATGLGEPIDVQQLRARVAELERVAAELRGEIDRLSGQRP